MPNLDQYEKIVEAFLRFGPRFAEVGRAAGVSTMVAQNVWYKGYADLGLPPIANTFKDLVLKRQQLVEQQGRTKVLRSLESGESVDVSTPTAVEVVRESATESLYGEIDILKELRRNVIGALGLSNTVLNHLDKLAQTVITRVTEEIASMPYSGVESLLSPLEKLTKATHNLAQTSKTVFELQRLVQGAPTQITEHRTAGFTGNQGVSPELQEKLIAAGQVIDMMRRARGLLPPEEQAKVIDMDADSAYEGEEGAEPMLPTQAVPAGAPGAVAGPAGASDEHKAAVA